MIVEVAREIRVVQDEPRLPLADLAHDIGQADVAVQYGSLVA